MQFTEQQRQVIEYDGGNLVVTASAGSGKTSVMTERFCRLVIEGKADADEILCVTFTRLAASELKKKLSAKLKEALFAFEKDKELLNRISEQIALIPYSQICTVDSFCNYLVKKYFYIVGADPQYSVIEEAKAEAMKKNAVDEVFERLYEEENEDIILLLNCFSRYRSDSKLKEFIISLHNFLSTETDKKGYLDKNEFLYTDEGADYIINRLIDGFITKYKSLCPQLERLISDCENKNALPYAAFLRELKADMESLYGERTAEKFLSVANKSRKKPSVKNRDEQLGCLSTQIDSLRKKIDKEIEKLKNIFETDYYENGRRAGRLFASLRRVSELFEKEYASAKAESALLDYADLEYYAYKILSNEEALAEIKGQFKYIFVDEYQDTNALQDAIFSALQNDNLFIVGDLKQSIYAFRGCDCELFDRRIANVGKSDKLVSLDKNFRSAKSVTECVNNIFSRVMTKETMNVDYASNPMRYGGLYPNNEGVALIVKHIDGEREEKVLPTGVYSIEKHLKILNAKRASKEEVTVRKLVENVLSSTYVDEKGRVKTYSFGDIAIITRTNRAVFDRVAAELIEAGIPVVASSKRSVGDYPEIRMIIGILQCVDYGGREDFSLATALKSPIGGFSNKELLAVRRAYPKEKSYFEALSRYESEIKDRLTQKIKSFKAYISKLRLLSNYKSVSEVLKTAVIEKDIELYLLKTKFGDIKCKRVNRFINELEGMAELSVADFIRNKDSILKNMTVSFAEGDNAVKILDIHQSKGLEFPVVILCELERDFYSMNGKQEIMTSLKDGIGLNCYDAEKRVKVNTLQRYYINYKLNERTLQDEMRLFYVAATRAMHRLYMVTTSEIGDELESENVPYAKKFSDFLSKSVCGYIASDELTDGPFEKQDRRTPLFAVQPSLEKIEQVGKYIKFEYPFSSDTSLSLKTTVTEATRRVIEDFSLPFTGDTGSFGGSGDTRTGNAYHKFLQHCSFNPDEVACELEKLMQSGVLDASERQLLSDEKLKKILSCEIFARLNDYKLYREQPFMSLVPASMLGEQGESEVLIQGVIDLLAVKGDEAIIIDYKYSGLSDGDLVKKYEKQLELYAYAVKKVLLKEITATYLFNINTVSLIKTV